MRKILTVLLATAALLAAAGNTAGADPLSPGARLLVHCLLDKSNSLDVYLEPRDAGGDLKFQVVNFLLGPSLALQVRSPMVVEYGDVLLALRDEGRSGYFFLRLEKGRKPSPEDAGNSTVLVDNNLFQSRDGRFFTGGQLTRLHDCSSPVQ